MGRRKKKRPKRIIRSDEPVWNPFLDSKPQMMQLLNYYNAQYERKDANRFFSDYLKYKGVPEKTQEFFQKMRIWEVPLSICWVARQICIGDEKDLPPKAVQKVNLFVADLVQKSNEQKKNVKKRGRKPQIQENLKNQLFEYIGFIEYQVDQFLGNNCKSDFGVEKYLESENVTSAQSNEIGQFFEPLLSELKETLQGECEQLVESYGFLNRPQLKRYVKFVKMIIEESYSWSNKAKRLRAAKRKPRKRKIKAPIEQVAKLKYLKESEEFSLKSVLPSKIIGATQLWVFNTRYRTLGVYHCPNAHGFSVKGCTIQNFDLDISICKRLRKPEKVLEKVLSAGKVGLRKILPELKTKENMLTGRINKDTILLRVL